MNRVQLLLRRGAFAVCVICSPVVLGQPGDDTAIRQLQDRQADAWNRHDAAAYAKLFTTDGDVVNVLGWWWRGRQEIETKLAPAFASVFRDSKLTIADVQVRFLTPTVAIAHVRWTMEGAKAPPGGPPPREGIQLQVLTRQADGWLIASFQNTNSIPEAAFPMAPPPMPATKQ
jgi:uncharacterized protein (TIGR02246 family)